MVIYWKLVHFLMSLNSRGTFAHCLCLIFNELELYIKTARDNGHRFNFTVNHFVPPKVVLSVQLLHQTN